MKIVITILIPIATFLTGCNQAPESDTTTGRTSEPAAAPQTITLQERASALAEGELARLAATEMIYRNKTYYYEYSSPLINKTLSGFGKMYRQFTGFEIRDIVKSPSILRPVTIIIRFNYDVIGTKPEFGHQNNYEISKIAQNNNNYQMFMQSSVSLKYACDEDGAPLDEQPKTLPRLHFWKDAQGLQTGQFPLHPTQFQ